MTRLAGRIRGLTATSQGGGTYHPAITPATPVELPAAQVTYSAQQHYPWRTVRYETVHPRYTADGAEIPSTAAGPWGSIYPAGRP